MSKESFGGLGHPAVASQPCPSGNLTEEYVAR